MKPFLYIAAAVLASGSAAAELPMPPVFAAEQPRTAPLQSYPLGVVDREAAFAHHGTAHHEITLPNGLQGWVYEVRGERTGRTYVSPEGQEHQVVESEPGSTARTYTLVFGAAGTVIDVLYNETGRHDGLSAVQVQRRMHPQGQALPPPGR